MARGLLLVLVDPPPTLEAELNDWYDTEHLPERAALPGFQTALRFTSLGDGPRYAAVYDLDSPAALATAEYNAVSGVNFSPWTRRVTRQAHPLRLSGELAGTGGATQAAARLVLVTLEGAADPEAATRGLAACYGSHPGHLQSRVFRGLEPEERLICLSEFSGNAVPPLDPAAFGPDGGGITLAATYRPYRR